MITCGDRVGHRLYEGSWEKREEKGRGKIYQPSDNLWTCLTQGPAMARNGLLTWSKMRDIVRWNAQIEIPWFKKYVTDALTKVAFLAGTGGFDGCIIPLPHYELFRDSTTCPNWSNKQAPIRSTFPPFSLTSST